MPTLPKDIRQFELNFICSALLHTKIRTSADLWDNFAKLVATIKQNPDIFKTSYSRGQQIEILKAAIKIYNDVNTYTIKLSDTEFDYLFLFEAGRDEELIAITLDENLSKLTKSYDRLERALEEEALLSKRIQGIMKDESFVVVPQVILGAGDTGTTLWLEKFKDHHDLTKDILKKKEMPKVLMIGKDAGSWSHNYTLAQPHNILERGMAKENPSAYLTNEAYQENPHANGRHVYQSNQVNLALTQAPLLRASVIKIEKQENHGSDWQSDHEKYRLVVMKNDGIKQVYTNEINICTGLGPARNALSGSVISTSEFERLCQFDSKKEFTPIVDGNQFILSGTEEAGKQGRKIVIYGGGGTAAACYRKGFFGHDLRTEHLAFEKNQGQKHSLIWVAKQFDKAGTGKLATAALTNSARRDELKTGELVKIESQQDGKLLLGFKVPDGSNATYQLECDQFVYSIGQDDSTMRSICAEIETDIDLVFDDNEMVLNISSADKKIVFFGAAAMAVREKDYMAATWKWLREENIGGDVGPGSMPPSRAQIKRYNFLNGMQPTTINANMDSKSLTVSFLEDAGVKPSVAQAFTSDLIQARKHGAPVNPLVSRTSGAKRDEIEALLKQHKLDHLIEVQGHGHLVKSAQMPQQFPSQPKQPLLSWLGTNRQHSDAKVLVSNVKDNEPNASKLESIVGEQVIKSFV